MPVIAAAVLAQFISSFTQHIIAHFTHQLIHVCVCGYVGSEGIYHLAVWLECISLCHYI